MAPPVDDEQITVMCCGKPGCGHKVLGVMAGTVPSPVCPTHNTPLIAKLYAPVRPRGGGVTPAEDPYQPSEDLVDAAEEPV